MIERPMIPEHLRDAFYTNMPTPSEADIQAARKRAEQLTGADLAGPLLNQAHLNQAARDAATGAPVSMVNVNVDEAQAAWDESIHYSRASIERHDSARPRRAWSIGKGLFVVLAALALLRFLMWLGGR